VETIVPVVEPVLTLNITVSEPSVVKSSDNVSVTLAVFADILKDPLFIFSTKSEALLVPELVQYNVVPLATLEVLIVNTTD
jgi:hypothetical protein